MSSLSRASWSSTTPAAIAPGRCAKPGGTWRSRGSDSCNCRPRPGAERHRTQLPHRKARGHAPTRLLDHQGTDGGRGGRLRTGQRTAATFKTKSCGMFRSLRLWVLHSRLIRTHLESCSRMSLQLPWTSVPKDCVTYADRVELLCHQVHGLRVAEPSQGLEVSPERVPVGPEPDAEVAAWGPSLGSDLAAADPTARSAVGQPARTGPNTHRLTKYPALPNKPVSERR